MIYLSETYTGANGRESPFNLLLADQNSDTLVIFAHGYKGFKDWGPWGLVAARFASSGMDCLKFNFSHNGGTVDNPIDFPDLEAFSDNTYSKELFDLREICRMAKTGIATPSGIKKWSRLVTIGHSRGGGIAILNASANPDVDQLITWASVADFGERFNFDLEEWKATGIATVRNGRTGQDLPHKVAFYEDFKENEEALFIKRAAVDLVQPWLIIHGSADEAVSFGNAERLHSWNPKSELRAIINTGHTFGGVHPWEESGLPEDLEKVILAAIIFIKTH